MGQKIHPIGMRIGIIRDWESKWYANKKEYKGLLLEDLKIRAFMMKRLKDAALARVLIERAANRVNITIHTAKPGMVIGKGGTEVDNIRNQLNAMTGKRVHINIAEIKSPDLDAKLVAENIAQQLERRVAFRRAMRQGIQRTLRSGAKGIKVQVSGRWAEQILHVQKAMRKEQCRYTHCVRTLTTHSLRHTPHTDVLV